MENENDKEVHKQYFVVKNVRLDHNHQNLKYLITGDNHHFLIQFHEYVHLLMHLIFI